MTDYLALALEQGEEETAGEARQTEGSGVRFGLAGRIISGLVRLAGGGRAEGGKVRAAAETAGGGRTGAAPAEEQAEKIKRAEAAETPPAEGTLPEGERAAEDVARRLLTDAASPSWTLRFGGEAGERAAAALLDGLRRTQAAAGLAQGPGRRILVTLPETGESASGWGPEALDRAVERDARRYDGGFALY